MVVGKTGHHYLGEPDSLFYWGPSRAKPLHMSDFMAAIEAFFADLASDQTMPSPPKTVVLFHDGKMVWLNNAEAFTSFTRELFVAYEKQNRLAEDTQKWEQLGQSLAQLTGKEFDDALIAMWRATLFAEFALYGAESALAKRFNRFDPKVRQHIWGVFTAPKNGTFLNRIDAELLRTADPKAIAQKYPWIQDGYSGTEKSADTYFVKRLAQLQDHTDDNPKLTTEPDDIVAKYKLTQADVDALELASGLAEFMDRRKAWMMQTRRLIKHPYSQITDGWLFADGQAELLNKTKTAELWDRYVQFRSATSVVSGIVASNGGHHFINGEVAVVSSPTDAVAADRILVVPSTSPSYVPLMRTARALITDHGGLMSHAAIVAREFGLPCIVGTNQATKVLKTGDKVVLDLVTGEVDR